MPAESPNPDSLSALQTLYSTVSQTLSAANGKNSNSALVSLNKRLNTRLKQQLNETLSPSVEKLDHARTLTKTLFTNSTTLPATVSRDLSALSSAVSLDTLEAIPDQVKKLLSSFQNAVDDPTTLYPRIACCAEVPVDPAKLYNIASKHRVLQTLYEADSAQSPRETDPAEAPRSTTDVLATMTASLGSLSNDIFDAVAQAKSAHAAIADVTASVTDFSRVTTPVEDLLNGEEEAHGQLSRLLRLFSDRADDDGGGGDNDASSRASDSTVDRSVPVGAGADDPVRALQEADGIVDTLTGFPRVLEEGVSRLRDGKAVLVELGRKVRDLFERAVELFHKLVAQLRRFVENLPRMIDELRHFFYPTGLRALVMKPAPGLVQLLDSVEQTQRGLPDAGEMEKAARGVAGDAAEKVDEVRTQVDEVLVLPAELVESVRVDELKADMVRAAKEVLLETAQDAKEELLTVDGIAGVLGFGGGSKGENGDGKDDGKSDEDGGMLNGMLGSIAAAGGGLFSNW